jgi:hypothetical protein
MDDIIFDNIKENVGDGKGNDLSIETKRRIESFYLTFTSDTGKGVLEYLKRYTLEYPNLSLNSLYDGDLVLTPQEFMFVREGQNQVIRYIENVIKKHHEGSI